VVIDVATSTSQPLSRKPAAIIEVASETPSLLGWKLKVEIRIFIGKEGGIMLNDADQSADFAVRG
jgi:hypothetical protein